MPLQVGAQSQNSSPLLRTRMIEIGNNQASVSFADLGYSDVSLISPIDSTRELFSIPPNWKLIPGGDIVLNYDVVLSGVDVNKITDNRNPYGGAFSLSFNSHVIATLPLGDLGSHSVTIQIPDGALVPSREDGRHQLTISLDAQFSCIYDVRALITIKNSSIFNLKFEASSPKLDLSKLPAPFYLRNSFIPDSTLVIVPDAPSELGMKAALNLMAGLGSIIGDTSATDLVSVGQLTDQTIAQSNLIFVGKPDTFGLLSDVQFPLPVAGGKFSVLPTEFASDGILEMAVSPWNSSKVVLLVSGAEDASVLKAAQAFTTGKVMVFENPALAFVSDVQLLSPSIPVIEDFTLESIGYDTVTLSGIGENSADYVFNVSKEQVKGKDGSIDLVYFHSALLDYGVSSLTVSLNDQIIGSAIYNSDSEKLTTLKITVPPGLLRYGENRLSVGTNLIANTSCDLSGFSDPWLVVSDQTSLHLPAGSGESDPNNWRLDLKFFPSLFLTQSDLGDLAFVLPKSSPNSWKVAGQLAYQLGLEANPVISNLGAAFADNVPVDVQSDNSLIVVGKASELPFLTGINDLLPAPFDPVSNTATEKDMQIIYRIPAGVSVGYLELLHSPFSAGRLILVASGNDDSGLLMSGNTLTQNPLQSLLSGQFAVTNGIQVASGSLNSQSSIVGTIVPQAPPVIVTPIVPGPAPKPGLDRPAWLMTLPIISGILILLIIIYVIYRATNRREEITEPLTQPRYGDRGDDDRS